MALVRLLVAAVLLMGAVAAIAGWFVLRKATPGPVYGGPPVLDPEGWRRLLGHVRAVARGLARQGKLVILRHNKPADPGDFKGVYRLRLPIAGDPLPEPTLKAEEGDAS